MTIKRFIEAAIEGGYKLPEMQEARRANLIFGIPWESFIVWDPEAWKAVGRTERWDDSPWSKDFILELNFETKFLWKKPQETASEAILRQGEQNKVEYQIHNILQSLIDGGWRMRMHCMIDALADGKTIEQFLGTLI